MGTRCQWLLGRPLGQHRFNPLNRGNAMGMKPSTKMNNEGFLVSIL